MASRIGTTRQDIGKGRCVLVVDDITFNRRLMELGLPDYGFEVLGASDGAQAVDIILDVEVTAILMDIEMPVLDGIAATQRIRAAEAGGDAFPSSQ